VRLSDIEPRFTCTACGKRGAVNTAFCFGCRTPNYSHQVHAFEVILQLVEVIR
jgi:hypothetical protein